MTEIEQHIHDLSCAEETNQINKSAAAQSASRQVTTPKPKGVLRSLFDDLSIAQVIAGALAAATVFFLSSVIGVAGSLIGAAIGSIISALSSQIYKKALSASADKIRDAAPTSLLEGVESASKDEQGDLAQGNDADDPAKTRTLSSDELDNEAAMRVKHANDVRYTFAASSEEDPALRRAHARRNRKARVQRNVLIVSIVSSLVAIIICSAVIIFATQGEGIGVKTEPIISSISRSQESAYYDGSSDHSSSAATDQSESGQESSSQDGSGSVTSGSGQDGSSSTNGDDQDSSGSTTGDADDGSTGSDSSSGSGSSGNTDEGTTGTNDESGTDSGNGQGDTSTSSSSSSGTS